MSKVLKTLTPILGKLVLMVGSGIIAFYAAALLLFELGVAKRLHDGSAAAFTGWVVLFGVAAIGLLAPRLVVWLLHKTGYKRPWTIVATLELMVVSAVVTFAMLCFTYWKLLSGHYHPALNWGLWGLTAIGFLAPGVIVWYLQKRGNKRAWIIIAMLALIVVSGTATCGVLLHIFSQLPPPPPDTPPVPTMTPVAVSSRAFWWMC